MARRVTEKGTDEIRPAMLRHMRELGLPTADRYLAWCRQVGVAASLDKSRIAQKREQEILAAQKAAAEARTKIGRNPRRFLTEACAGNLDPGTIDRPGWGAAATAIAACKVKPEDRDGLAAFLLHIEKVGDLVFESTVIARQSMPYLQALLRLYERKGQWLRDPLEWKPATHNARRQFSSLLRHLLARFDVPVFLDAAWLRSDRGAFRFRDWFIHVGRGNNIRTAKTPYPLTKMIAHHFINAPDDTTIEGALMLADVQSLNGSARLASALMATRLGHRIEADLDKRAFWLSVYRFFIANPLLDLQHAGPIVDFLNFQKFETQEVLVGPGRVERRPPPQPNLTMTRRTPDSLLRQVDEWHGELRIRSRNDGRFWRASGIRSFTMQTGPRDRPHEQVSWTTRELLSGADLADNGRDLRHCVASYASSCAAGACSIWSLDRKTRGEDAHTESVLTIEIDAKGTLIQARGLANRWPTEQEKNVLAAWSQTAGLRVAPSLFS